MFVYTIDIEDLARKLRRSTDEVRKIRLYHQLRTLDDPWSVDSNPGISEEAQRAMQGINDDNDIDGDFFADKLMEVGLITMAESWWLDGREMPYPRFLYEAPDGPPPGLRKRARVRKPRCARRVPRPQPPSTE